MTRDCPQHALHLVAVTAPGSSPATLVTDTWRSRFCVSVCITGFDVLVDEDLKPWLLEVNTSPSLACGSPLDMDVKTRVVTDLLNMVGIPCGGGGGSGSSQPRAVKMSTAAGVTQMAADAESSTIAKPDGGQQQEQEEQQVMAGQNRQPPPASHSLQASVTLEASLRRFSEASQKPLTEVERHIIRDYEAETARTRVLGCGARLLYPAKGCAARYRGLCANPSAENVLLSRWVDRVQ
jgi:hypothetical protein